MTIKNNYGSEGEQDAPLVPVTAPQTVTIDESISSTTTTYPVVTGEAVPLVDVHEVAEDVKPVFQDVTFAILFLTHLALMAFLGVRYGSLGLDQVDLNVTDWKDELTDLDEEEIQEMEEFAQAAEEYIKVYPQRVLNYLVLPCAILSFLFTYVSTVFVIPSCPAAMISFCLLGSVFWTILVTLVVSVATQSPFAYIGSAAIVGVVLYFVCIVWKLIPFAAVNLGISLQGISANWGMYIVAFFFSIAGFAWMVYWLFVTIGLLSCQTAEYNKLHPPAMENSGENDDFDDDGPQGGTLLLLLISLYWTSTVLLNTVQVTVAGVMGTWCYDKQDASFCCSPAVGSSLYRSLTYSFGSICLGSLLQALMTVVRIMVENARNQRNEENENICGTIMLCILECIVRWLEDIIDYFNQWAYVYVGIYGYSYLESGKRVIELFRARGWTSLITNRLVQYVLGFTTFTVAVVTGVAASVIDALCTQHFGTENTVSSFVLGPIPGPRYWAFGVGFIIGVAVSSAMMNVIQGAVNTLIVCFADDPAKLEENHPEATKRMADTWTSVFPEAQVQPSVSNVVV